MKCTATARIQLPWGGKILNLCPAHAHKLQAGTIGIYPKTMPLKPVIECESESELSEEEAAQNRTFYAVESMQLL